MDSRAPQVEPITYLAFTAVTAIYCVVENVLLLVVDIRRLFAIIWAGTRYPPQARWRAHIAEWFPGSARFSLRRSASPPPLHPPVHSRS